MGHGQVMALTQDEMTKQKSINILSYWVGFYQWVVLLHRNERLCRDMWAVFNQGIKVCRAKPNISLYQIRA